MKSCKIVIAAVLACAAVGSQAQSAGPTGPQIAAIVVTANQVDIDAAKLAMSRSQSKDVKAFAQEMVKDHGAVNKSATALVHKLKVTPEDSDTSQSLKKGGDRRTYAAPTVRLRVSASSCSLSESLNFILPMHRI